MRGKARADFSQENHGGSVEDLKDGLFLLCKISLVVPIYNEAAGLGRFLAHLDRIPFHEIILVDGGSRDRSLENLARWISRTNDGPLKRLISSSRGRARQMNAGAKQATGDVLLFLHADTCLPDDALSVIRAALAAPGCIGGAFRLSIDSPLLFLKAVSGLANLRSRLLKLPYGDQGYFVRKEVFDAMGGYAEIPLMEDVEFYSRLKRKGRIVLLKNAVSTSARRWQREGYSWTSLRNSILLCLYVLGVSPYRLAKWYPASTP